VPGSGWDKVIDVVWVQFMLLSAVWVALCEDDQGAEGGDAARLLHTTWQVINPQRRDTPVSPITGNRAPMIVAATLDGLERS
jgi:hypothetical protein